MLNIEKKENCSMKFLRKKDDACYQLASMQAGIFERSVNDNIASYFFIQEYMNSFECSLLDNLNFFATGLSEFEIYLIIKRNVNRVDGEVYPLEIMHWMGFFYRYASYLSGISSKKLLKVISPKKLLQVYPLYHGLDIEKAVELVFEQNEIDNITPQERFLKLYKKQQIIL